jgi:hypothetical protein
MNADLFGNPTLIGLRVKLDRPVDRERPCCNNVCIIGVGKDRTPARSPAPTAASTAAGCPRRPRNGFLA